MFDRFKIQSACTALLSTLESVYEEILLPYIKKTSAIEAFCGLANELSVKRVHLAMQNHGTE